MYNVLDFGNDDDSATDGSVANMHAAAAVTGSGTIAASSLGQGTAAVTSLHPDIIAAINQSIAPAFNQVVQNQSVLQQQIAAMSLAQPPRAPQTYMVPPAPPTHVAFPMQLPFQAPMQQQQYQHSAVFGRGQGYARGTQSGRGRGQGGSRGRPRRPSFSAMMRNQAGTVTNGHQGMFAPPQQFGGPGPFAPMMPTQMGNAPSPIKRYRNWNACFSCGFDVADGHTLATCPMEWRKPNHQVGYTRENLASFAAYAPCTKGQHKMQFPMAHYPSM